ncbi:MAG: phosphate signaling complex protein PhoU [Anaerolineales bacterium]|nr:MAG: phosphate signaling complex protein PhoU [Anaerolineales bacterium]
MSSNLRATFDKEYAAIVADILKLGSYVDQAIDQALDSLQRRDLALAQQVIDADEAINALRFKIEEACLTLIATQQPAARDLRGIVASMNIVVDIERMGDHAAGMAKTVIRMGNEPLLKPLIDIPRMVQLAHDMLRQSLEAFVAQDAEAAKAIVPLDDEMDNIYRAIFDELVEMMAHKPDGVERATYLLWCAHNLERIGDRVTNIAERVIFMTTGDMQELNV